MLFVDSLNLITLFVYNLTSYRETLLLSLVFYNDVHFSVKSQLISKLFVLFYKMERKCVSFGELK